MRPPRKNTPKKEELRIRNTFACNIHAYRSANGLKQREMAVVLDVELHNVQTYEEKRAMPSVIKALDIAEKLGVTIEDLMKKEIKWPQKEQV